MLRVLHSTGGARTSATLTLDNPRPLHLPQSRVTLIMPFYNYSSRMREAFDSLVNLSEQETSVLDLVVVNNGSSVEETHKLFDYIDKYTFPFHIELIRSETNLPLGYARNMGARRASGDFIGWIDPDDAVLTGRVSCALEVLSTTAGIGIFHANAWVRDSLGRHTLYDSGGPATYQRLQEGCCVSCQSTLMPTWLYFALGGQRNLPAAEDYDMWLRAAAHGVRFIHVPAPVYVAVQHERQKTRSDMLNKFSWNMSHEKARASAASIYDAREPLLLVQGPMAATPFSNLPIGETAYMMSGLPAAVTVTYPNGVPADYSYSIGHLLLLAWRSLRAQGQHQGQVNLDGAIIEFRNSCDG